MNKALMTALALTVGTVSTVSANTSDNDSVNSWGPWSTLATAAGPVTAPTPSVDPLSIRIDSNTNFTEASPFEAEVSEIDDGSRSYAAIRSTHRRSDRELRYRLLSSIDTTVANPDDPTLGKISVTDEYGNSPETSPEWGTAKQSGDWTYYQFENRRGKKRNISRYKEETNDDFTLIDARTHRAGVDQYRAAVISGTASSIESIQALGNTVRGTLKYTGRLQNSNRPVRHLTVNFTDSTWSAHFKANEGFNNIRVNDGAINGATLTATQDNISLTGSKVNLTSGSVNASFLGNTASTIGGIVDVSGTLGEDKRRFVDVFAVDCGKCGSVPAEL